MRVLLFVYVYVHVNGVFQFFMGMILYIPLRKYILNFIIKQCKGIAKENSLLIYVH